MPDPRARMLSIATLLLATPTGEVALIRTLYKAYLHANVLQLFVSLENVNLPVSRKRVLIPKG